MTRPVTSELDRLAHGRAISKDAFLGLLADPAAQEDLARIADTHDLLEQPSEGEPAPPALEVSWEDLAGYADGTLTDPRRRQAVEQFLVRQAPELLRPAEETPTALDIAADTATWIAPRPRKDEPGSDKPGK
jgi:hypothetical protein